jgi:hypothetical protein
MLLVAGNILWDCITVLDQATIEVKVSLLNEGLPPSL